ncbi:MAG TPA: hypothetical protein VN828_12750 [Acidobacteriaceae bacterium]|nr:hypothetical protein [Acidobacteriaceae bacterium]
MSKLDFLDHQVWTAFAENKSALKADREPVPQGRQSVAQGEVLGSDHNQEQSRRGRQSVNLVLIGFS